MWELTEKYSGKRNPDTTLFLPFEKRQRSRMKVKLENGESAVIILPRGGILRDGDLLRSTCDKVVSVKAAKECVTTVCDNDPLLLTKAAYHLGNRHVALQIEEGLLRYQHDHVLDELVHDLGLKTEVEDEPFEPESGAYSSHDHSHSQND